jgi:outer membrane autotransporter protein
MLTKKHIVPAIVLGLVAGMAATLAQASDAGFYVGGQVGYAHTNFANTDSQNNITSADIDNDGIGWGGLVGYQFNPYAAVELGYLGAYGMKVQNPNGFPISESLNMQMVDLLVKGILPLNDVVSIYGKAGVASVRATAAYSIDFPTGFSYPTLEATSVTETKPVIGAGISWDIKPRLPLDISWLHVDQNGGKIPSADFLLVGLSYHFS